MSLPMSFTPPRYLTGKKIRCKVGLKRIECGERNGDIMAEVAATIFLDADIRDNAQSLFAEMGLDLSTAINIFLRQSLYEHAIPFTIHREIPNAVTRAALEEGDRMLSDPSSRRFHSVDELFEDLDAE